MLSRTWTTNKIGHHQEQQTVVIPTISENLSATTTAGLMVEQDQSRILAGTAQILQPNTSRAHSSQTGKGDPKGIFHIDK